MTLHSVALFRHIMATVGLFVGFGFEWLIISSLKRNRDAAEASAWMAHLPLTFGILISSLVLPLASGVRLARPGVWSQGWIEATIGGLLVIAPFGAVGGNRVCAIRRGVAKGQPPTEVRRQSRDVIPVGIARGENGHCCGHCDDHDREAESQRFERSVRNLDAIGTVSRLCTAKGTQQD